jgi:hypothetical protein
MQLKVEELSAAPASTFEDEISEPEFDSIGGALAAMNESREPKGEYDDSSDDDVPVGKRGDLESESESEEEGADEDFVE